MYLGYSEYLSALSDTPLPMPKHQAIYQAIHAGCAYSRKASCIAVVFCCLLSLFASVPLRAQVDVEMVTNMGRNALSVDDYLTAIRYFNQAIESKPFLSQPYYYRAYAKFTLEDYLGAEKDCTRSIELNPFIVEVYQLRGLCRIHNNDYAGAISDYSRVLSEQPTDPGIRYNRALCYLQLKNYEASDSDLTVILHERPNFYRAYMVKAQVALEQKDTLGGMVWIDSLLSRSPKEYQAWSFKGRFALNKGEYALADSCLTQAIRLRPNDFDNYTARAAARHALGKFGLAIADYDRTIELCPDHFVAHYNRGLLRSFVGDLNRAIKDFDFIISVEPDNTLAIYNRAQLRAKTGDYRGAISDYTKLIKAYPTFYYGYMARAECRRKIGDTKGAQADETVVARHDLDLAFGKPVRTSRRKVRLRSDHELDKYQQLVEEDPDTVRNVFGTLYGKVQNEQVDDALLPMYSLGYRPLYSRGYHAVGYMSEVARLTHTNSSQRVLTLTAEADPNAAHDADEDEARVNKAASNCPPFELSLVRSAIATARYDYTSALNEVNHALRADSTNVAALIQRAYILSRSVVAETSLAATDVRGRSALALSDLKRAGRLSINNAYVPYNLGCLYAERGDDAAAIESFSLAIALDPRLPEAYYNRAMLYAKSNERDKAIADFGRAGQLGIYKAYARLKLLQKDVTATRP